MTIEPSNSESDRESARRRYGGTRTASNAGLARRATAAILGGALLVSGLRRRSLRGAAIALAGGWLVFRALGGSSRSKQAASSRTPPGSRPADSPETTDVPRVSRSVTVGESADELYRTWRDPDRFSEVMGQFAEVTESDGNRLHWTVRGPRGRSLSWETHVVEEEPGEYLRWEATPDARIPNGGEVRFRPAPDGRGTEVTLSLYFDPPGGAFGNATLQKLDIVPKALAGTALDRFKALAESGEIPTLEGNPSARGAGDLL